MKRNFKKNESVEKGWNFPLHHWHKYVMRTLEVGPNIIYDVVTINLPSLNLQLTSQNDFTAKTMIMTILLQSGLVS